MTKCLVAPPYNVALQVKIYNNKQKTKSVFKKDILCLQSATKSLIISFAYLAYTGKTLLLLSEPGSIQHINSPTADI
jgi:hypothetical protein